MTMNPYDNSDVFYSLRPELELLVRCVATHAHDRWSERIEKLLKQGLDLDYLVHTAARHRVVPLLHRGITNGHTKNLPASFLAKLKHFRWHNMLHSLSMLEELLAVTRIFRANGIPTISYKGPLLAHRVYGDPALRQFFDLDLITRRRDVPAAVGLLRTRGYRLEREFTSPIKTLRLKSDLHPHHEYKLINHRTGITVELHCLSGARAYAYPLDAGEVWKQVETVRIGEETLYTLPAEAMMLVLCVHGTKHFWACLQWLCDVAELVHSHPNLNWDWILKTAFHSGNDRILLHSLLLARQVLGMTLPLEIEARVKSDAHIDQLAAQARNQLLRTLSGSPELVATALRYHFGTLTSGRHKTAFVLHKIIYSLNQSLTLLTPTEKERNLLNLPEFLTFLYVPMRLARLAGKYYAMALLGRNRWNAADGTGSGWTTDARSS